MPPKDPQKIDAIVEEDLQLAHQSRADIEAWSAVFVVSCVRKAAIGLKLEAIDSSGTHRGLDGRPVTPTDPATVLKASRRHSDYIVEARKAVGGTYQAFEPTDRAVQIGDIICTDRKDFIEKPNLLKDVKQGDFLHGDIVTQVKTENGKLFAETIGGNVGHTVRRRRYPLNAQGQLIVSPVHLFDQEDDTGAFPPSTPPKAPAPTMLAVKSTGRILALLSLVEECKPASGMAPASKIAPVGKQERFVNHLIESLESPFFDEEILQPQPRNEFESSVERLVAESPFMGAFDARYSLGATAESSFLQSFAEDFLSPDEPETHEVGEIEEVELWEPFIAESEPEEYEDLATEGSADGIEFDQPVRRRRPPPPPVCSAPSATTGHWLKPFIVSETTIPKYKDKRGNFQATGCSVYVPDAAWREKKIDLLVFFHGDPGPCMDCFIAVLYKKGSRLVYWNSYYKDYSFGFGPPPNLRVCSVDEGAGLNETHCRIPTKYIGNLLLTTRSSPDWCKP